MESGFDTCFLPNYKVRWAKDAKILPNLCHLLAIEIRRSNALAPCADTTLAIVSGGVDIALWLDPPPPKRRLPKSYRD